MDLRESWEAHAAHPVTTATGGFTAISSFASCLNQANKRSMSAAAKDG